MKKYIPYVKKYWYCFILGPLFMVMEASGEFILPYINANIINIGAANGDIPYIIKNGLFMALIALGMLITGVLGANFAIRGAARLAGGIRKDTFCKIQSFSFSNIDDFTPGSLITRITNDVTQIENFTRNLLRGMFRSPVMLIGAVMMSFTLNKSLALIILIVIPILAAAIASIILIASPRYTKMQEQIDRLNINVRETATNVRVIKSFVREEYEKEKFSSVNDVLVEKSIAALKMMMLIQPASALAINVTTLLVVWVAGKQIMVGDMELGTLTAFITYLTQILNALNFLANIVLQGTRAAASDKRISAVLNAEVELNDDMVTDKSASVEHGKIEFKNVTFRYFKNNPEKVLDDVSFEILPGEFVGIIGSTGSGKTTLVSMIPRLYDADEGEILIDGKNVREWPLYNLRESISVVLQNNTLFSGTVAENLRWGNEDAGDEEIMEAAKIAQADGFIQSFRDGYDTELEHGGANLSGGQKQRLCIARALLKNPKILILDDSTSAVDTATDAAIRRAFREKLPGVTKLVIAQRINSVMDADKIIVLEHGRIVGCGRHSELMDNCPVYAEIYWSQKDREEKEDN
ncbi:MAG: ABC transporter ATP-binding protein/permease [Lachnospiraceae bacterium]|nr:ABC transporter ATP-binding protein/permease [Lachnospiraceae bacterium]